MKKIFFILTILTVSFGFFLFKSVDAGQEKLVSLKNYKVNIITLEKFGKEYEADLATNTAAKCKYGCYAKWAFRVLELVTYAVQNVTTAGEDLQMRESEAIQLEQLDILNKI